MSAILERLAKIKNELDARRYSWLMLSCLSEEEINKFEQSYGVDLPDEYRFFLLTVGDGGPGPFYGIYPLNVAISSDPTPYKRHLGDDIGEMVSPMILRTAFPSNPEAKSARDKIVFDAVPGTLALAHYGCAAIERLVISGEAAGSMWHDYSSEGNGIHDRGETFLDWYEKWLNGNYPTMWKLNDFMTKEFRENEWMRH